MRQKQLKNLGKAVVATAALAVTAGVSTSANATVDRGFIAPHEYALPLDFKPFNIFAQYAFIQSNDKAYNNSGNKVNAGGSDLTVGLTKYVRLWQPDGNKSIGLAWEVIVPEIGIRDKRAGFSTGGFGDPITGAAAWIKPAPEWTLGADLFVSVPVGDAAVGGGDRWDTLGSIFWDAQYGKFNYTGNLGYHFYGTSATNAGNEPGDFYHLNNRFGYRMSDMVEPYVGVDYQFNESANGVGSGNETALAAGAKIHIAPHTSIAAHYSRGIDGKNSVQSDSFNMRFVYVF